MAALGFDLRDVLSYCAVSGLFHWKVGRGRRGAGDMAGSVNADGYVVINLKNHPFKAHRVAWFFVHGAWPTGDIDHRDTIRHHNWISNLRPSTRSQNMGNCKVHADNRHGLKGVCFHDGRALPWQARIMVRGRRISIGYFATKAEAHEAYALAAVKHFEEFARAA